MFGSGLCKCKIVISIPIISINNYILMCVLSRSMISLSPVKILLVCNVHNIGELLA